MPGRRVRRGKKRLNLKVFIYPLLVLVPVIFAIYAIFNILTIKTYNPTQENISQHKILSQLEGDVDSTVYILEREKEDKRKISDVYVFLSNRNKEVSLLIYIPGSLYFNGLEEDIGSSISISSLRYAGDFFQEGRGVEYALWQLNEVLGFKVNNYIWITTEAYEVITEVYGDMTEVKERYKDMYIKESEVNLSESFFKLHTISSKFSSLKTLLSFNTIKDLDKNIYSNLSFFNVLRKINSLESTIKLTQTNAIDMGTAKYSKDELSEKGGQIRSMNVSEYDKALRGYMFKMLDKDLEKERVRVEVYNGSSRAGRAGLYARKLLNYGCDVVRFGNAPENIERTQVYISDREGFKNSFNIVFEVLLEKFEEIDERPSFMTTGDIVILLGEDISQVEIF